MKTTTTLRKGLDFLMDSPTRLSIFEPQILRFFPIPEP
jgi:hypothetical protein